MDIDSVCDLCGGELNVEIFHERRELVCENCSAIIDSEEYGENMEPEGSNLEVME